jgi:DNA-binding response OmpR family regulator
MAKTGQKILVVEDEPDIRKLVNYNLAQERFKVLEAEDGEQGLKIVQRDKPDLVILDLMLPGLSGMELCKILRERSETERLPVLMLTAKAGEADRVVGLEMGADDYLTKPFSPRELVARVKAVLRRTATSGHEAAGAQLHLGDLLLDTDRLAVTRAGTPIDLTATEFQLVATLARQPGRVFTRAQLLDAVRGDAGESFDRAIDAHVKNVRRKLEADTRNPRYILTVYGVGYKAADL